MKINKFETARGFAKKLQKELNTGIEIQKIGTDHHHFIIKDEFNQRSGITVCVYNKNLTFQVGNDSHDYVSPDEFSFNLLTKLTKFFNKLYETEIVFDESDLDDDKD